MCGDHPWPECHDTSFQGSPPRVRGPLSDEDARSVLEGFTPACAGTTHAVEPWPIRSGVHPRVCGNHMSAWSPRWMTTGSPPRVRGPLVAPGLLIKGNGFTPACAGTTRDRTAETLAGWVHPRVCGDHLSARRASTYKPGSPPRVRGPPPVVGGESVASGFTPACAGTTRRCRPQQTRAKVHPRVCGDHVQSAPDAISISGSPPRVRGPHHRTRSEDRSPGFTPACTGTTVSA